MPQTPAERDLQYQIVIEALNAINQLRVLSQEAASFDQRITAVSQKAQLFGKQFGFSGAQAVSILKQMDQEAAAVQNQYTGLGEKSVVFGNYSKQAWADTTKAVRTAEGELTKFGHGIDFLRVALGTMAAVLVFQVGQAIVNTFTSAIESVKTYEAAIYNARNAEKVLSESGLDITFRDLIDIVDALDEKFVGLFSKVKIQDTVSDIAIATKEVKANADQIQKIAEAAAVIQLRTPGSDLQQIESQIVKALLSGRTQGLQALGVAVSEEAIKEEALARGLAKTGEELDKNTKFAVALELLYQSTSKESESLAQKQNSLAGASQKASAQWQEFLSNMGQAFAPAMIRGLTEIANLLERINGFLDANQHKVRTTSAIMSGFAAVFQEWSKGGVGVTKSLGDMFDVFKDGVQDAVNYYKQLDDASKDTPTIIEETTNALVDLSKVNMLNIINAVSSLADRLGNLGADLDVDLAYDFEDFLTKQKRSQEDYQIDVEKVQKDAADKRQDIERRYRENELNSEAKFQQQLKELRDKYLFDLEDALRARDARQVLRLMAQYRMDKEHLIERHNLDQQEKQSQYQQDLEDARKQEADKLAEMAAAQALKEQRAREDYERERARRIEQYERDIEDVQNSWEQKLLEEAAKMAEEFGLNEAQMQQLYELLSSYYGPEGAFDNLYDYSYSSLLSRSQDFMAALQQSISQMQSAASAIITPTITPGVVNANALYGGGFRAEGGIDIVNSPTKTGYGATYGDAGTEAHIFIPLGSRGSGGVPSIAGLGGGGGKLAIEILLSDDLESRIVTNTMNKTADVITRVRRGRHP